MPRRRNEMPTDRFNVTLPRSVAERVRARASAEGRSAPAVVAAIVATDLVDDDERSEQATEVGNSSCTELARERDELAAALAAVRRELARQRRVSADLDDVPRWVWPIEGLLMDRDWWAAWLPRLYELLGGDVDGLGLARDVALDPRGYVDLMARLFPPVDGVDWRSPKYPSVTARAQERGAVAAPARANVWEPVVRHVACALAALEATGQSGADPYHALRVQAEIAGPWVVTLRRLLGESHAELRELPGQTR